MASERRNPSRERMRYGICLNDECEMCRNKTIQKIPMRKDFVCQNPDCGKELRECPPPKKQNKMPLYIAGALVALCVLGGGMYALSGGSEEQPAVTTDSVVKSAPVDTAVAASTSIKTDTVVVRDTIIQNNTTTISEKTSTKTVVNTNSTKHSSNNNVGTLRLSYGLYHGEIKGGFPHGQGRLTYSTTRQINRYDTKQRMANKGESVIGEFYNGFVVYGKHYDSSGNLIEALNFGIGSESIYELK